VQEPKQNIKTIIIKLKFFITNIIACYDY
jgi:hypothetical protein